MWRVVVVVEGFLHYCYQREVIVMRLDEVLLVQVEMIEDS